MNDSSLPEDLARWPKDPYQLLGVTPNIDPRELRKIYTRLIRAYKPEQFPEHFRRIRDAYEVVLRQAEFYKQFRGSREEDGETERSSPTVPNADKTPSAAEEIPAPREWQPVASLTDELVQLWQRACSGEEAAVYRRLVELHSTHPAQVELLQRLYWLLALTPELDPERSPADWLMQGLPAAGLAGPLWELYRREIAENPAEALSERCTRLLRQPAGAGRLGDLAECRWHAAGRLGRWQVMDDDLEFLHGRLGMDDQDTWVRLLVSAAEQLLAMPGQGPRDLAKECLIQIEHFDQLQLRGGLDQLEFYREVAAELHKLPPWPQSPVPPVFTQLIKQSWIRPFTEIRPLLLEYLERMAGDPRAALKELDALKGQAPAVLSQFSNVLTLFRGSLIHEPEESRTPDVLAGLVRDFLEYNDWSVYEYFRPHLLDFCLTEAVSPEVIVEAVGEWPYAAEFANDGPLRCVYWGCRLFWG
jgi:hypothetical protein